jgi:hypothetical protein
MTEKMTGSHPQSKLLGVIEVGMFSWTKLVCIVAVLAGSACSGPEVGYTLVFPSLNTFLLAVNATVTVYDGAENSDQICRNLSVNQAPGTSPLHSSGKTDVCEFIDGRTIDGVDTGRLVLFAEVGDRAGTALMRGCRVADVYPETENIDITLSTLPTYPEDPVLTCSSVKEKCEELKSCTED